MMLLRKMIKDARWLLLACAASLYGFSWIRVVIVSSMETYQIHRLARNLPEFIQRMSPVPIEQLVSYPGLIAFTFEEPLAYLIMAVWTISRASDSVSGELGRGTLEMMLAQPLSRSRYLLTHTSVTITGILILAAMTYAGTSTGIHTTGIKIKKPGASWNLPLLGGRAAQQQEDSEEDYIRKPMTEFALPKDFRTATINYACLGFFLAGLTSILSAVDRYRWRTIGIVVAFYVVETIVELTGMAVEGYAWLLNLTFFAAYEPVAFVTESQQAPEFAWSLLAPESTGKLPDLGPLGCDLVLLIYGAMGFVAAWIVFQRRDLPAPL